MSIDSDIEILNHTSNNNIFDKLIAHDKDFVGGLYSIKKPGTNKCSSIPMDENMEFEFNTGLREMKWLSSGCWCLKRSAVEKMVEAYPELEYDGDDNASGKNVYGLYIPFIYDFSKEYNKKKPFKKYLSEDWAACQRWRQLGGKIWADTSMVLRHHGKIDYTLFPVEFKYVNKFDLPTPPPPGFNLEKTK